MKTDNADYFYINIIFLKKIKKELKLLIIFLRKNTSKTFKKKTLSINILYLMENKQ